MPEKKQQKKSQNKITNRFFDKPNLKMAHFSFLYLFLYLDFEFCRNKRN